MLAKLSIPSLRPNLPDAGRFDNGRFLLPLGKIGRLYAIRVDANELFSIAVDQCNLPLPVPAPPVLPDRWFAPLLPTFHFKPYILAISASAFFCQTVGGVSLLAQNFDTSPGLHDPRKAACWPV